jgi:hypothetical protein
VTNTDNKRFKFRYEVPEEQLEALLELARLRDKGSIEELIEELIVEAVEEFIARGGE